MLTLLCLVVFVSLLKAQQCLTNPPNIVHGNPRSQCDTQWVYNKRYESYDTTLTFDAMTYNYIINNVFTTFTVRSYNYGIPGPTWNLRRGNRYRITLINNLGPESPDNPTGINEFKDVNQTNIHTHGLHISGESPSDSIFIKVENGETFIYDHYIPCNHAGGTFWYHPHLHGSTMLQVNNGAAGMIIVEEDAVAEGLPDWLNDMDTLQIAMQRLDFDKTEFFYPPNIDFLTQISGEKDFILVNGEYQPTICMKQGEWMKWRMLYADIEEHAYMNIYPIGACSMKLLARDGVLVHGENNETPRDVDALFFHLASRIDIAINCDVSAAFNRYELRTDSGVTVAYIHVEPNSHRLYNPLTLNVFNPIRPLYLQSLLNYGTVPDTNKFTIIVDEEDVNGIPFPGETPYLTTIKANSVQEWTILQADEHPYHQHINHFQQLSNGRITIDNWDLRGDFIDTLVTPMDIRFHVDTFGGNMILHCHILEHEDEGAMANVFIEGGCDYDFDDFQDGGRRRRGDDSDDDIECDYVCD